MTKSFYNKNTADNLKAETEKQHFEVFLDKQTKIVCIFLLYKKQ